MRSWHLLAIGGLLGVASLWLVPLEVLFPDVQFTTRLRLLSLIQPTIFTLVAVFVGHHLSSKVGLGAPLLDALSRGDSVAAAARRIIPLTALAGLVSALIIIAYGQVVAPELGRASPPGARLNAFEMPVLTKLLYGGITEEILTRWGLVSLFAWIGWRLSGRPEEPAKRVIWLAIVGSALLFAVGHVPMLILVVPEPPTWMLAGVLLGNAIPGVLFGWLFWRVGIEAAIFAHMLAHLFSTVLT